MNALPDFQEHHADWLFHRLFLRYYDKPADEAKEVAKRWMRLAVKRFGWTDREKFIKILDKR